MIKNNRHPYNTGLAVARPDVDWLRATLPKITRADGQRGMVFMHRVEDGFSPADLTSVRSAECVYSELPWGSGWARFHERAGLTPLRSYMAYLQDVWAMIGEIGRPAFIVCSKAAAIKLGHGEPVSIDLNGGSAWLARRNVTDPPWPAGRATGHLLAELARRYRSVYDFGCGFGTTFRYPFEYFIGTDIDQKCLAYVARQFLSGQMEI